jgi:hypothetical protein
LPHTSSSSSLSTKSSYPPPSIPQIFSYFILFPVFIPSPSSVKSYLCIIAGIFKSNYKFSEQLLLNTVIFCHLVSTAAVDVVGVTLFCSEVTDCCQGSSARN